MRRIISIAGIIVLIVGAIVYNTPEGTFSPAEHEHLTAVKMYKSEALVLSAKDCYRVYLEAAEMEIGKSVSKYQWVGENHPSNIKLSVSKGYRGYMSKIEQGLTRVVLAGLIFHKERPANSDSAATTRDIADIASKLDETDRKKLEANAKTIVARILLPYKRTLEQVSLAETKDQAKSYLIPKEPKLETWHTLFQDSLASNSQ